MKNNISAFIILFLLLITAKKLIKKYNKKSKKSHNFTIDKNVILNNDINLLKGLSKSMLHTNNK